MTFQLNDPVLLVRDSRRRWIKTIVEDKFHCNYGYIELADLVGKPYGTGIDTSKGVTLYAYPPTMIDWINQFEHQSQIIYEKDAAMILLLLNISPGQTVYETGTGSGSLTAILANALGNTGKVVTHDNRPKAIVAAQRNLKRVNLENVEFHERDVIEEGFVDGKADAMVLDMGDPWRVISHVPHVLKPGGKIVIFVPTFEQLGKTAQELKNYNFRKIKAIELIEREIQLKEGATRPATRMIGHTGYLMSALSTQT